MFAILVAIPTALVTFILTRGQAGRVVAAVVPVPEATAAPVTVTPASADPAALVATPLAGAERTDPPTTYDAQGLFEYIDGAAPLFLERHFESLVASDWKTASGGEFTCDIYLMATPDDAAAIYDKERPASAKTIKVGDTAHGGSMALVFRKGRAYVKLTAFNPAGEAALPSFGEALIARLP
ncbi:MAG: DUF6599 family protein [Myxococcota bacterium]